MWHLVCSGVAAIFKPLGSLFRALFVLIALVTLFGFHWPFGPPGPTVFGAPAFIPGLFIGTALMVLVPYLKESLQGVAETGDWRNFLIFDWRYLALFLLPILGFGVGFLTVEGLWEAAHQWGFVQSVGMAYTGVDLVKEVGKASVAAYAILTQRRRL